MQMEANNVFDGGRVRGIQQSMFHLGRIALALLLAQHEEDRREKLLLLQESNGFIEAMNKVIRMNLSVNGACVTRVTGFAHGPLIGGRLLLKSLFRADPLLIDAYAHDRFLRHP